MLKTPKKHFLKINFESFLIIYILLQPFIDVATSLCIRYINSYFTIGILLRSLFLIFILIYSISISNKRWKRIIIIYCSALFIYSILFFINAFFNIGFNSFFTQLKSIIKTFYFSIILISLIPISINTHMNNKYLIYCLFGYTSILSISTFLGIAFDSYADGSGAGKNGLFYAANEIGTILCILMPFLFLNLIDSKLRIIKIINLIFLIFSSLWMGTKVPFLGLILSLIVSFIVCIINIIKRKNIKEYLYKISAIILLFFIVFTSIKYSPIGKNLGISINKITNITEKNSSKSNVTRTSTSTQPNIETVILSSRDIYYKNTLKEYKNSSIPSKILGIGYLNNQNGIISQRKTIEIDYFDILFSNGIIGFILFFTPLLILLIYIIKLIWKQKFLIFENNIIFYIYTIFICLIIARLAGHIFTAPAVNFYLALTISNLINILKKDKRKNEIIQSKKNK